MAVLKIPVRSDLDRYSFTVSIDGVDYQMLIAHNTRDDHWYLSVSLTDGTRLASGIPIVANTPLLARWQWDQRLPQDGYLMAVDTTGEAAEPEKDDLGERFELLWIPLADVV